MPITRGKVALALRKAAARKPEYLDGPDGKTHGYSIDLSAVSVAAENIFYNYDDAEPASVAFRLSNRNRLVLFFPEQDVCHLIAYPDAAGPPRTPTKFRTEFNCPIGFVPILGPVDHKERLYKQEAARQALFNYTAARNFRNIWYHFPERFNSFRERLRETWPGMDVERPQLDLSHDKPLLHMFCPEERIPREVFWAGFGFQVWCQMLTHLVQSDHASLFLIDEPDIYLHSELQRQLLGLLRDLGSDVLIATHSTEIITEAEPDDIVLISKKRRSAKRIKHPSELAEIFSMLGSNLNPLLTQLAKTRRAVFVEGKDFQIVSKFARRLGQHRVANRSDFAVVPVGGFSPERIRSLKNGMETTLGGSIRAAAILDRDYRSQDECDRVSKRCLEFCSLVEVHGCKEIENFLLLPNAIDRAATKKVSDSNKRSQTNVEYAPCADAVLNRFAVDMKTHVTSRFLATRRQFERETGTGRDDATCNELALREFEGLWDDEVSRIRCIPGKEALSRVNEVLQEQYGVSVTPTAIVSSVAANEVPEAMRDLVDKLIEFGKTSSDEG